MTNLVDSHERDLNPFEIVTIGLQNMKTKYPLEVALPAVMTEMNQPNAKTEKIGNTFFLVLTGKDGQGFFKAFNADTPANYVENGKEFCLWAKEELGMHMLVTEFEDPVISKLFHIIAQDPPMDGMGFKEYKLSNGDHRIVLNLGE